jgi:Fe-S oxidoreductase
MALTDFRADALRCTRCSHCKWIPFDLVKSARFAKGCPSVDYHHFHSYSGGGRLVTALSLMDGRSEITDQVTDIAFACQLCGNCDVACKICRYDMEVLAGLHELRAHLAEQGKVPASYGPIIERLRAGNRGEGKSPAECSAWADGLGLKDLSHEKADVLFFAGCKYGLDDSLRETVRTAARVLLAAGLAVGILPEAGCCGGLAYDMGYREEFATAGERTLEAWQKAGVRTVVTPCANCYHTFKRLYPQLGSSVQVLHTVETVDRLIKDGRLEFTTPVDLTVTYHDPCHLGRQGEPYVAWDGGEKKIFGQAVVYDPPRPRYNGAQGIYQPPRDVLAAIPGLQLVEMDRNREAAWCCGAGGACREAYPEFSAWAASERIEEAKATGADALVSACSRCELNFSEAVAADAQTGSGGQSMQVFDVLELVSRALGQGGEAR